MRKIPTKNYFKLVILVIVTVFLTLGTSIIYTNYRNHIKSYISQNLTNIQANDLDNYLQENSLAIIYIGDIKDTSHDDEEKELLDELNNTEIRNFMVFIDNNQETKDYFKKNYKLNIGANDLVIKIEDKKIVSKLTPNTYKISEFLILLNGEMDD